MKCKCEMQEIESAFILKILLILSKFPVFQSSGDSRIFGQDREDEQDEMQGYGEKSILHFASNPVHPLYPV